MRRRPLRGVRFAPARLAPYGLGRAITSCRPVAPGQRIQVCVTRPEKPGRPIRNADDVCALLRTATSADRESFYAVHLDSGNRVLGIEELAKGTLSQVETTPREIFKSALLTNAHSIILAHNHPSGSPAPSETDLDFTRKLLAASRALDIPVRDHVIVAAEGCTSLRERGLVAGFQGARRPKRRRW